MKAIALSLALVAFGCEANAVVTAFAQKLAGFNAAAGSPPVVVDFEDIPPNTDISGQTIRGITFIRTGAPLIVVVASNTFTPAGFTGVINPATNKLVATSGINVLSPGGLSLGPGPAPDIEADGMELQFALPVSAVGFDHLSQSADGYSMTSVKVYGSSSNLLYSGGIIITNYYALGGGAPGAADFWGIVSTETNICRVVISETDSNAEYPDANIGYDTFRVANLRFPEIYMVHVPGGLEMRFSGNLESASSPAGPWGPVSGANSPLFLPESGLQAMQFYRATMPVP
jgi:hypothetical protein